MERVFEGVATAIVTPFKGGRVDYVSFGRLIDMQVAAGVSAIVVLGTTGESACISAAERKHVISFCVHRGGGEVKIIVGTGSNSTKTAIKLTKQAESLGADAALVVTPYYNKCTQHGLFEHYKAIASNTNLPIIVYNVPSRTGVNILPETALELSKIKNIVGLKEANSDLNHINAMTESLNGHMTIYSGNDNMNMYLYTHGGGGIISVVSNVYPKLLVEQFFAVKNKNFNKAYLIDNKLKNFYKLLFLEVNPIGIKYCLSQLNLCKNELRLPLTTMSNQNAVKLNEEIKILQKTLKI